MTTEARQNEPGAATAEVPRLSELPAGWLAISPWRGIADTLRTWLGIVVAAAACGQIGHPLAWLAGAVVIAGLQNHLMVLWHHSIHGNIHPNRRVNEAIGRWLLIAPMAQPAGTMARAHLTHHAYLGRERDPDRWYYDLDLFGRRSPGRFVGWLVLNCLGGLVVPQVRKLLTGRRDDRADPGAKDARVERIDQVAVAVDQVILFGLFWAVTGLWWAWLALWAVPAATLGGGLNCLRTSLEHADPGEPPHRNFSFDSNPVERFFVAPFQMNYHYEHHALMRVPYYRMPELRRFLVESGRYGDGRVVRSYLGRIREIARELWRPGAA